MGRFVRYHPVRVTSNLVDTILPKSAQVLQRVPHVHCLHFVLLIFLLFSPEYTLCSMFIAIFLYSSTFRMSNITSQSPMFHSTCMYESLELNFLRFLNRLKYSFKI
jgi:hypothetical protein